jgi:hypothetical protein
MNKVTIIEAEQKVIDLLKTDKFDLTCFLFYEDHCPRCNEFIEQALPWLEEQQVSVYAINTTQNFIPFPPAVTPTTYWYILKDVPPMVKKGMPPSLDMLKVEVDKMISVNKGESTIEETFF